MGWLFGWDSKQGIIDHLNKSWGDENSGCKYVTHRIVGNHLWKVVNWHHDGKVEPIITLDLLEYGKREGWGYKGMSEDMHPYFYDCPMSLLAMAPVKNQEWRDKVIKYHERQKRLKNLRVGEVYKLINCKIPEVKLVSVKPLLGTYEGVTYRVKKTLIDI